MTIFCLSHSDYEEYSPFLLFHDSKTQDEWRKDAADAMNIAAGRVVNMDYEYWIGSHDIVRVAVNVLIEKGYTRIEPIEVIMQGSGIMQNDNDIGYALDNHIKGKIFEHNRKVGEKLDKETQEHVQKFLSDNVIKERG